MGLRDMARAVFGASDRDIELCSLIRHNQSLASIENALDSGANANARDTRVRMSGGVGDMQAPLHYAVQWRGGPRYDRASRLDLVKVLLKAGADPDPACKYGHTPLHNLAIKGDVAVMELLLDHKAEVNVFNGNGNTPLHNAAQFGHPRAVELLINRGADINAQTYRGRSDGKTPLHSAIFTIGEPDHHIAVIELLLAAGADTTLKMKPVRALAAMTPVDYARDHLLLVKHGANACEEDRARSVSLVERMIMLLETAGAR